LPLLRVAPQDQLRHGLCHRLLGGAREDNPEFWGGVARPGREGINHRQNVCFVGGPDEFFEVVGDTGGLPWLALAATYTGGRRIEGYASVYGNCYYVRSLLGPTRRALDSSLSRWR